MVVVGYGAIAQVSLLDLSPVLVAYLCLTYTQIQRPHHMIENTRAALGSAANLKLVKEDREERVSRNASGSMAAGETELTGVCKTKSSASAPVSDTLSSSSSRSGSSQRTLSVPVTDRTAGDDRECVYDSGLRLWFSRLCYYVSLAFLAFLGVFASPALASLARVIVLNSLAKFGLFSARYDKWFASSGIARHFPPGGAWKLVMLVCLLFLAPECSYGFSALLEGGLRLPNFEASSTPFLQLLDALYSGDRVQNFFGADKQATENALLIAVMIGGTGVTLLLWHRWQRNDYSMLPIKGTRLVNLLWVSFFNAYVEEVFFRGLVQEKLFHHARTRLLDAQSATGLTTTAFFGGSSTYSYGRVEYPDMYLVTFSESGAAYYAWLISLLLQAVTFGALHYYGIPSGFAGVGLTSIYGVLMGCVAMRFGSLLVPIFLHTAADFVIFYAMV
ncbi:unnamed protein product [Amoebophrya sp. A25]|nr:unnamed protein product [Amoebophrya sp. A25]|eukprot:GSA25T00009927001.1